MQGKGLLIRFAVVTAAVAIAAGQAAPAAAFDPLFDSWMGFITGDYTNARSPWAAAVADLNGDEAPDVVVAQWPWATGFACLINRGDGTFHDPVRYSSAFPSVDIAIADFDGDGDGDVVLSNTGYNYEGSSVSVYRNNGAGLFAPQQQFTVGSGGTIGPSGVAVADFNQDEHLDVAVAQYGWIGGGTLVSILFGDGTGAFGAPHTYAAGPGPYKLAAGDLTGDGYPDLAVGNWEYPHTCTILRNDGTGGFLAPTSLTAGTGVVGYYPTVALGDVDNDEDLDVLYSNTGLRVGDVGAISLFRNPGNGVFSSYESIPQIPYSAGPVDIEVADIDQNGWVDLLGAHFSGRAGDGVMMCLNNGAGGFLPATLQHAGQQTVAVVTADVNGDSAPDILTADNFSMAVTVHENQGGGTFKIPPYYLTSPISLNMDAADIDLDGDLDVLTTGGITYPVSPCILKNDGAGVLGPYEPYLISYGAARGKLRDLNGDHYPDMLIAAGPPYPFLVGINNGDGTFAPFVIYPVPSCGGGDIDAFDLDGDGDLDVCYEEYLGCPGEPSADRVFISLNRGDGTFEAPYYVLVDIGSYGLVGADFNGDDIIDLATSNYGFYGSMNVVDVLIGIGNGSFLPYVPYVVPNGPKDIVAVDLNGDSILDLATCNTGNGASGIETTSVLMGNGNGTFQGAVTYIGSYSSDLLGASGITCGDPDGDGDVDLMVSNAGSNDFCYYANRGDGTFETPVRYGTGKSPHSLFYADFTGDGVGDVAAVIGLPPSGLDGAVAVVHGIGTATSVLPELVAQGGGVVMMPASPNPFTLETRIEYRLQAAEQVRVQLYDTRGRLVTTLRDGMTSAGLHQEVWDGRDASGRRTSPGVYFLRLETGSRTTTGKLLMLR